MSNLDHSFMNTTFWKTQLSQKFTVNVFGFTISVNLLGISVALLVTCIGAFWLRFKKKPTSSRKKPTDSRKKPTGCLDPKSVNDIAGCLDPKSFKEFKLIRKTQLNHNTARFRFALPTPNSVLGLPVGHHVRCKGRDNNGNEVTRPYTPITLDCDHGYFELVVKMYPIGRMSHHFREMRVGDYLAVKGPMEQFKYRPGQVRSFGMLAGGSGITPMFQVTRAILENPTDKTKVHLIYANVTVNDILLKEELDEFAQRHLDQFKVYYVLSQPPEKWDGGAGQINKEMIQKHCPEPALDIKILKCGPQGMNKAMAAHLKELGYTPKMQFGF